MIPRLRRRYARAPLGMTASSLAAALVSTMVLAACNADDAIRRVTPADADARARDYLGLFTRRQVDSALARLIPSQATIEAREQLSLIAGVLADQRPDTFRVVGVQVNTINGTRHTNLTYELHSARGWSLANVATVDTIGTWFVEGVSARTLERSLEEQTRFTLADKSLVHYLWLLLMVFTAAFSLGTAVFIATRRGMPKRWWWVFASIIGVSPMDLNWATSAVSTRMLSVQLFSAAFLRAGPAAPWIFTFALPLGAGLALERYGRWRRERERLAVSSDTVPIENAP